MSYQANVKTVEVRRSVDEWVESTSKYFTTYNIWARYNITSREGKDACWHRLEELAKRGVLEKDGQRYRKIEKDIDEIDIFNNDSKFHDIKFPFDLHKYIRLSEKSIMVVAGEVDAGKTGLLLNTAVMNMLDWDVHFFNSETGTALLRERLFAIDPNLSNPPLPFKLWDRMDNFADVIRPDALNIIDYLDIDSEIYMVGAELKKILSKLNKGVAIIGLQKPPDRDLGYGGTFSIKKAEVYLSMSKSKLKIVKAKSRANPNVNPINKTWTFQLTNKGTRFDNITADFEEPKEEPEQLPF